MSEQNNNWERGVLEKLACRPFRSNAGARHWGIFFKTLTFAYLFILLALFMGWMGASKAEKALSGKHTALVELNGVISADSAASADNVIDGLQEAFKDKHTQGVILRINSPGGSPVQAGYINDEIRRLRVKISQYSVVCRSGGYLRIRAVIMWLRRLIRFK